ncbi:MAG: beta-ketoacyl-ACP synthase III [Candidatus Cyclobacteriaceae bacterium M2_1C_046]
MTNQVYITKTASYLPNAPVSNDEMEEYLGFINGKISRSKNIVLRNNKIKCRYYAIDKVGKATHSNALLTANAIRALMNNDHDQLKSIDLISCGTSTPDQIMPSHAVMVHGELPECGPVETVSPSGVCCSGMHAFKYAYMSVKLNEAEKAVATGSERVSRLLHSTNYADEINKLKALEKDPYIGFEKDFLRWMLSDGAGALLLTNKKNENSLNLRVDWIESVSFAHEIEPCMYMGGEKLEDGTLRSYMDFENGDIMDQSLFSIKQDVRLLNSNVVNLGVDKLKKVLEEKGLKSEDIDYFLPHMSSHFFKDKIAERLKYNNIEIPEEKWFTNLETVGNVGSASIYLMIDELVKTGKLNKGEKILLNIPESSRFSYVYSLLTVE